MDTEIVEDMLEQGYIGRLIAGQYTPVELLARGGSGVVYRATEPSNDTPVAIKIIQPNPSAGIPNLRARFFREAQLLSELQSPNIAALFDYGEEDDGTLYMVQEFIGGRTLGAVLKEHPRLEAGVAAEITCQILDALTEAHRVGIIHRDIKPGNLMLTSSAGVTPQVKVLDFGQAKPSATRLVAQPDGTNSFATATGILIGTPRYMSPEQILQQPVSELTDIYAVGVVLYRMLAGRIPFKGTSTWEVLQKQVSAVPPPLPDDVPAALAAVATRALTKNPTLRFKDAASMVEAICEAAEQDENPERWAALAHRRTPVEEVPAPPQTSASPWPWALVGAVLLAAGIGIGLLIQSQIPAADAHPPSRSSTEQAILPAP